MIFFLVSASVPIDIRAPIPPLRALSIRGRCTATWRDYQRGVISPKTTFGTPHAREAGAVRHPPPRDVGQTAGGGSLRCCCSVVVWLPSAWVVVATEREVRPRFSVTAVSTITRTPARTRIHPTVVRSTALIESCTAYTRIRPTARRKTPSPYPMETSLRSCPPGPGRIVGTVARRGRARQTPWGEGVSSAPEVRDTRGVRSPLRLAEPPVPAGYTGTRLTACNLCEAICGLELTLTDGKVTGIRGNPDDPLSRGYICPKGVALADVYDDPDRLRRPIRRVRSTGSTSDPDWEEIGWDEALDLVADGLAEALNRHGRNAVGIYLGNPNAHALGSATHAVPFVKSLRTRNRFSASTVDQAPHQLIAWQMFGHQLLLPIPDLDRTSYLLVLGANPMASNGSLMTTPDFPNRAKAIKQRGGRIVVLDPRRTETAKIATEHVFVRPGGDVVVLLAMLRTILTEDLAEPPTYVDGVDELTALVQPYTPALAEQVSGIPAA